MNWITYVLSFFLVIACLLLMLLVLIQLPKKEAGMGQAFGGGATDALFGAGSGTALTKMTKYLTGIFFVLTLLLWVLKAQEVKHQGSSLERTMQQVGKTERTTVPPAPGAAATAPKAVPAVPPAAATAGSNTLLISTNALPITTSTNAAAKASTNVPAAESPK